MRVVVTGAAGFIGSHVAEALAGAGHEVLSLDRAGALIESDLAVDDLAKPAEADVIVHLAGRPGVRSTWAAVERDNIVATRRLLAACAARPAGVRPRVVVASSSSVYGSAGRDRPTHEDDPLLPGSPYARSKAEVERLAVSAAAEGLPVVLLRYFSVYGPRQRPDMAFHRFVEAALDGRPLPVFGDGLRSRSFTHVDDVVAATLAAVEAELPPGIPINVGHPEPITVRAAIGLLAEVLGVRPEIRGEEPVAGDATRTWADAGRAARLLGWSARIDPAEGIADQVAWHRGLR
ncbi:NAD-dependent epimerase/dehydratase family protein [Actinomadura sp. 9N407]|uniref:NAD-dependent epimerase/dehydratase family protein n=1 Tax=Actinomadura sp. 9N407 TaxID=3375154 RepID=UPI00379121E3